MDVNWALLLTAFGVGITAIVAAIGGNAFVMQKIIDTAITKLHLLVSKQYVTKEEFDKHIEHCPYKDK